MITMDSEEVIVPERMSIATMYYQVEDVSTEDMKLERVAINMLVEPNEQLYVHVDIQELIEMAEALLMQSFEVASKIMISSKSYYENPGRVFNVQLPNKYDKYHEYDQ